MSTTALERLPHGRPRIVVGVDGSAGGEDALSWAVRQAVLLGASLDAVACWQVPEMFSGAAGYAASLDVPTADLSGPTAEMLDKAVAATVGDVPGADAVTVRPHLLRGDPVPALLQMADGADLLVVGSRGHGEPSAVLLGSVGLQCVTHAPCPVVVVRGLAPGTAATRHPAIAVLRHPGHGRGKG